VWRICDTGSPAALTNTHGETSFTAMKAIKVHAPVCPFGWLLARRMRTHVPEFST